MMTFEICPDDLEGFEEYMREKDSAMATVKKYRTDMETFFRFLGTENRVDRTRLLEYRQWLLTQYAATSANSMLAALNKYLLFRGYGEMRVKRIRIQKELFIREERELTASEYKRLVKTAKDSGKQQLALCMETIAVTGIRISELRFFTVEQVRRGRIEVYNKGKCRRIFLTGDIKKKLLVFASKHGIKKGCIFISKNGNPKDRSNIWSEMKALRIKAGINGSKIFPHNLRHLFARTYYLNTQDLTGLANLLGHSSLNVTRIYTGNTGAVYQQRLERMTVLRI